MPYLVQYLRWCANMVVNMAFTAFATGLLWSKHNFASYLHCANLMQIHFFRLVTRARFEILFPFFRNMLALIMAFLLAPNFFFFFFFGGGGELAPERLQ